MATCKPLRQQLVQRLFSWGFGRHSPVQGDCSWWGYATLLFEFSRDVGRAGLSAFTRRPLLCECAGAPLIPGACLVCRHTSSYDRRIGRGDVAQHNNGPWISLVLSPTQCAIARVPPRCAPQALLPVHVWAHHCTFEVLRRCQRRLPQACGAIPASEGPTAPPPVPAAGSSVVLSSRPLPLPPGDLLLWALRPGGQAQSRLWPCLATPAPLVCHQQRVCQSCMVLGVSWPTPASLFGPSGPGSKITSSRLTAAPVQAQIWAAGLPNPRHNRSGVVGRVPARLRSSRPRLARLILPWPAQYLAPLAWQEGITPPFLCSPAETAFPAGYSGGGPCGIHRANLQTCCHNSIFLGHDSVSWRPRLMCGFRIGEAANPGPPGGADVLALAETSAVDRVQKLVGRDMQRHSYRVHWGRSVACHSRPETAQPVLRGLAAGVALASRLPSRASRPGLPEEAIETCRLSEAFVRLGALEVRVITIYGWPLSHLDAAERNEHLLSLALAQVTQNAVPSIIAGDFNQPPLQLPSGQALAQLGYKDVFDLHYGVTGSLLPPTCKGSTRHDTALLHPSLLPLWISAWVLKDSCLFDSHDPLCFRLRLCKARPCRKVWDLPRSWKSLGVRPDRFAEALQGRLPGLQRQAQACASTDDVAQALRDFSQAAEDAVDAALAQQPAADPVRSPLGYLPKAFKGRCQPRPLIKRALPSLARPDRDGGFTPDVEVTSVLGRLKVRQVRRVLTFQRGLTKLTRSSVVSESLHAQLCQEWDAICAAKGYPPCFKRWVLRVACFSRFPLGLPEPEWVGDLLQYLQFDCLGLVRQQAKERKALFKYRVQLDITDGHSREGYKAIKPPALPPFLEALSQNCSGAAGSAASRRPLG